MQANTTTSSGATLDVRVITNGCCPPEFAGDVQFATFASQPAVLQEVTTLIKSRQAVVLADMAFMQPLDLLERLPAPVRAVSRQLQVAGRLGCPIPFPALTKNPELGLAWRDQVLGWQAWERLLCCHLQPLVGDGREQFARCFSFLGP
ncbi:uncharacterized protein HaLaN_20351 [Haematococcus lacustris]|uniref:Uncharacterized protein n=1 Tax=Haematococcus lacustris TaxID=44745 RepID=A0A699ZKP0_HAELA|nr:uncharacterized protein HaLaN_20351 [Haematococcus lacustris]